MMSQGSFQPHCVMLAPLLRRGNFKGGHEGCGSGGGSCKARARAGADLLQHCKHVVDNFQILILSLHFSKATDPFTFSVENPFYGEFESGYDLHPEVQHWGKAEIVA